MQRAQRVDEHGKYSISIGSLGFNNSLSYTYLLSRIRASLSSTSSPGFTVHVGVYLLIVSVKCRILGSVYRMARAAVRNAFSSAKELRACTNLGAFELDPKLDTYRPKPWQKRERERECTHCIHTKLINSLGPNEPKPKN